MSGNTGHFVDIFAWTWNTWSGRAEHTSKQRKMVTSAFEAALGTFCCYDHEAKVSEAVQKIAADQKEYCKCSLCVIICWKAKKYLSINNSEKCFVTRIPLTQLKKLLKLHTKKSNSWPMVSFIHDGSDITTWRKHSFKTKKHKIQCNILNVTMSFLNFKLQINRFAQGHWSWRPIH